MVTAAHKHFACIHVVLGLYQNIQLDVNWALTFIWEIFNMLKYKLHNAHSFSYLFIFKCNF